MTVALHTECTQPFDQRATEYRPCNKDQRRLYVTTGFYLSDYSLLAAGSAFLVLGGGDLLAFLGPVLT